MKILVFPDYDQLSAHGARRIKEQIQQNTQSVLGLATGSTPLGLYKHLITMHREGLDFSEVTTFNLDEYLGLDGDHPASYRHYMQENLFQYLNVSPKKIHIPDGSTEDAVAECQAYEAKIREAGGIDVQILGIGHNGHIGFNEPGTAFGQTTHAVDLDQRTREANARFFDGNMDNVPTQAISMGIKSIMQARQILLLASGPDKAEAVAAAALGPVTRELPASILQLHPQVTFLLDRAAAQGIPADHPCLERC